MYYKKATKRYQKGTKLGPTIVPKSILGLSFDTEASRPVSQQASKPTSQQASKPASPQASRPASQRVNEPAGDREGDFRKNIKFSIVSFRI